MSKLKRICSSFHATPPIPRLRSRVYVRFLAIKLCLTAFSAPPPPPLECARYLLFFTESHAKPKPNVVPFHPIPVCFYMSTSQMSFFTEELGVEMASMCNIVLKAPSLLSYSVDSMRTKVSHLKEELQLDDDNVGRGNRQTDVVVVVGVSL